jgi:hypothetical protein
MLHGNDHLGWITEKQVWPQGVKDVIYACRAAFSLFINALKNQGKPDKHLGY